MGCEERLKSAFIEKTKVEMALHRNLKSQKETEISLNEKIAESQNLFDENSQLKIAIENNKQEFGAEKENLKGEIEKIEKKLEELKKEMKIRNGKIVLFFRKLKLFKKKWSSKQPNSPIMKQNKTPCIAEML